MLLKTNKTIVIFLLKASRGTEKHFSFQAHWSLSGVWYLCMSGFPTVHTYIHIYSSKQKRDHAVLSFLLAYESKGKSPLRWKSEC